MPKLIVGLTGQICAGKTTVSEYLRNKHGAGEYRFSDILKDILKRLHLENKRKNLQALGAGLRECMGPDVLLNALVGDMKENGGQMCVIDGVRYPNEVEMIHKLKGIVINVTSPEKIRYERAISRGTRGEAGLAFEQFRASEKEATEKYLRAVGGLADYQLDNTGAFDDLYQKVDEILAERQRRQVTGVKG